MDNPQKMMSAWAQQMPWWWIVVDYNVIIKKMYLYQTKASHVSNLQVSFDKYTAKCDLFFFKTEV